MNNSISTDLKNLLSTTCNSDGFQKELPQLQDYNVKWLKERHILQTFADEKIWCLPCLLLSGNLKQDDIKSNNNDRRLHSVPKTPSKESCHEDGDAEESFAGSPLKLQEFHVDSFVNFPTDRSSLSDSCFPALGATSAVRPLSITDARLLLSMYMLSSQSVLSERIICDKKTPVAPVWVLCDGRDRENTLLMGAQAVRYQQIVSLHTTTVCVHGPVTQDSKEISRQWRRRPAFCRNEKAVTTKCFAKYTIQGSGSKNITISGRQSSLEIHCNWSRMTALLQSPPAEAKTSVRVVVSVGDPRSAAFPVYRELSILKGFVQGLESGLAQWATKSEDAPLLQRVQTLIQESGSEGVTMVTDTKTPAAHDDSVFITAGTDLFIKQRDSLDFTEQLWDILRDCTCYKDLLDCLEYVLDCLQEGSFQPVVNRDNKSMLGQLIRDSYYSKMTRPELDGKLPLQILVEIGLDKLANDHVHIFLSKELVTMDSLRGLVSAKGALFERLERLEKLHHVLELTALLESLNLPVMTLSVSARQALKHYQAHSLEESDHTFDMSVPTNAVKVSLDRYQPSVWRACMTSLREQSDVCAIYMFTEKPPFEHVGVSPADTTLSEDSSCYYMTILQEDMVQL